MFKIFLWGTNPIQTSNISGKVKLQLERIKSINTSNLFYLVYCYNLIEADNPLDHWMESGDHCRGDVVLFIHYESKLILIKLCIKISLKAVNIPILVFRNNENYLGINYSASAIYG